MTPKDYLTNPVFCTAPWTNLYVNPNGVVQNCSASGNRYGNINDTPIEEIIQHPDNVALKRSMLDQQPHASCATCLNYEKEQSNYKTPSHRTWYLKTMKTRSLDLYDSEHNFDLHGIDLRWRNTCNQACVYCSAELSSRWADELGVKINISEEARNRTKAYIYSKLHQLNDVYLAGGEPLLINDNAELLELLKEKNPNVSIRINTNLSIINNKIYNLVREFKNVHWIVSVDAMGAEYEYIRYPGNWQIFENNLQELRAQGQKISFNLVWCILNDASIFDCIDYLLAQGFHENSLVIHPADFPRHLDVNHLPNERLLQLKSTIESRLAGSTDKFLYQRSLQSMLQYLDFERPKNINSVFEYLAVLDTRRCLDSEKVFPQLYQYR